MLQTLSWVNELAPSAKFHLKILDKLELREGVFTKFYFTNVQSFQDYHDSNYLFYT